MVHGWFSYNFDRVQGGTGNNSPELFTNLEFVDMLRPNDRMMAESSDFFIETLPSGRVSKIIRRRNPENVEFLDPDSRDEEEKELEADSEDAMDFVDKSLTPMSPKDKWDLIFWIEDRSTPEGGVIKVEASAPWFPTLRDKRLRGYARNLEAAISRGISANGLYKAVGESLGRGGINKSHACRLWELFKIKAFLARKAK